MKLPLGRALQVSLCFEECDEITVGQLAERAGQTYFEYNPAFLQSGLQISPLKFRAKAGILEGERRLAGLPGVFHDSLPDTWGRLLVDRRAQSLGIRPAELTAVDRLACVGRRGVGALCYAPAVELKPDNAWLDLDLLARDSLKLISGDPTDVLESLFVAGGSPGGARPKVLVNYDPATGTIAHGSEETAEGEALLVKFAAPTDPADIGLVEMAYSMMAEAAGVHMMPCRVIKSRTTPGFFATQRFDRPRVHVHTLSGMLHADHTVPSLDYDHLLRVTTSLTRDHRQVQAAYRLMVFNVLAHNRDDHGKQFSFLMNKDGVWNLAPAYDLTCAEGPAGWHTTSVVGEAKAPRREHLTELARRASIKDAGAIIDEVKSAVVRWPEFASSTGLSRASRTWIAERLNSVEV